MSSLWERQGRVIHGHKPSSKTRDLELGYAVGISCFDLVAQLLFQPFPFIPTALPRARESAAGCRRNLPRRGKTSSNFFPIDCDICFGMSQAGSQRLCGRKEGREPEGSDWPGSIRASRPQPASRPHPRIPTPSLHPDSTHESRLHPRILTPSPHPDSIHESRLHPHIPASSRPHPRIPTPSANPNPIPRLGRELLQGV